MRIEIVTPFFDGAASGNAITAQRYAKILRRLGNRVHVTGLYSGAPSDLLVALHARRSHASIRNFRLVHPDKPIVVVLTGTDLYRDLSDSARAQSSLDLATRVVVLQPDGLRTLGARWRQKTRVIYQSALPPPPTRRRRGKFSVCVIANLRPEKDPFRTARASRLLSPDSRIEVLHIGRVLSDRLGELAARESERNPRYRWLGELSHSQTRRVLAGCRLLAITSRIEGSSNALSEALASSVPVLASRIPGLVGTLGEQYAGYYPPGDTSALARLLGRAECDPIFYSRLKAGCEQLAPLVDPAREIAAWDRLLEELRTAVTGANSTNSR
jgi:putative glycosyltransferase (TIGR04348 family)